VGLLAYSNGFGILSENSWREKNILTQELTYFLNLQDTIAPSAEAATKLYQEIARKMG
jgi:hypothetical protein